MSDGLETSFDRLSFQPAPGQPSQQRTQQDTQSPPSAGSHRQPQSYAQGGSIRSGFPYSPSAQNQQLHPSAADQSVSARFERFFSSGPPEAGDGYGMGGAGGSFGPGSAAAGLASSGAFGSFGHSFGPGGLGGSGHFDSSGHRAPGSRMASRGALPSQWNDAAGAAASPPSSHFFPSSPAMAPGSVPGSGFLSPPGAAAAAPGPDDDIIPTAIVVKNIPFSIKKEQLLQIIEDLQIPMPYAFNYHFDQGIFRGLAFANFRSGEEADAVVAALNGFDVQGRKLRVEYKKVLQAGEKERIEKEKAIKRMQSMQLEKERIRRDDWNSAANVGFMPNQPTIIPPAMGVPTGMEQTPYGDPLAYGGAPPQPPAGLGAGAPLTADSLKAVGGGSNGAGNGGAPSERSGGASVNKKDELDLNDPATLEIYSRVLLFKDDRMRDELSFSRNLSPLERRTVHLVAQKLGLYHYSMGEGEERYVVVTKNEVPHAQKTLRSQASTIGRSGRTGGGGGGGSELHTQGGLLAPGSSATTGRAGLLRMKKSAPDMKRPRDDGSSSGGASGAYGYGYSGNGSGHSGAGASSNGLLSPGGSLLHARKSNSNLREGMSATMGRAPRSAASGGGGAAGLASLFSSPFDVPPVPSLPSSSTNNGASPSSPSIGGTNGSLGAAGGANLLRQPRGPPTPGSGASAETRNFAPRARVTVSSATGGAMAATFAAANSGSAMGSSGATPSPSGSGNAHSSDSAYKLNDADVRSHSPLEI